jgi:hypothetical protein
VHFKCDSKKDLKNQQKQGVLFAVPNTSCDDSQHIIAEDVQHCNYEMRYYFFGKIGDAILSVRFRCRNSVIGFIGRRLLAEREGNI